jgi:hypothetical protein
MARKSTSIYMAMNVILTFDKVGGRYEDKQEFFDLKIPVKKSDTNVIVFLNNKFFPKIVEKCMRFNRSPRDLIKISTCSNWDIYEEITNEQSLDALGHSCKWHFGCGRNDLDGWEKYLMESLNFGQDSDSSWLNEYIELIKASKQLENSIT